MRCAILLSLCALMVLCICEARTLNAAKAFNKAKALDNLRRSKLFAQHKSRNFNFLKKALDENDKSESLGNSESSSDSEEKGGPGFYSLIGLHALEYVSSCLADKELMQSVPDEAWEILDAVDDEESIKHFVELFGDEPYFHCLIIGYTLHIYEDEPSERDDIEEYFKTTKEAHVCFSLQMLEDDLKDIDTFPDYVKDIVNYMTYHCETRVGQYLDEDDEAPSEGLAKTAVFDLFVFAGFCAKGYYPELEKECNGAMESAKEYALTWRKIGHLESFYEHFNGFYTCEALKGYVKESNSLDLSEIAEEMTGSMKGLIENAVDRECPKYLDDDSRPEDMDSKGDGEGDMGTPDETQTNRRRVQINREVLKKILKELQKKK